MSLSPTDTHADDRRRHGTTKHAEDPDGLVFVDSTGRRALLLRRAGIVFGAAVLVFGGMIGVAFMGGTSLAPSDLGPFNGGGTAQDSESTKVRPDSSPSALQSARPCRKKCARYCRKHLGKPCTWSQFRKAVKANRSKGPGPARSAPSSVEGP
ncbi:MAG TPA: hypothetical protein VGO89_16365 [Streptomyces sp.]|jgi:hypothetical protein|nr:hypothetical protein [Streptomyces sp.]